MNLYEIDEQITALVDPETGEILDYGAFESLKVERDEKRENIALWIKNLCAEAEAIKAEENALKARRVAIENKANSLKDYLARMLDGTPFKTARVACSFRLSPPAVVINDEKAFIHAMMTSDHDEYLNYQPPTINRTAIKDALKAGIQVDGAELVQKQNLQLK